MTYDEIVATLTRFAVEVEQIETKYRYSQCIMPDGIITVRADGISDSDPKRVYVIGAGWRSLGDAIRATCPTVSVTLRRVGRRELRLLRRVRYDASRWEYVAEMYRGVECCDARPDDALPPVFVELARDAIGGDEVSCAILADWLTDAGGMRL